MAMRRKDVVKSNFNNNNTSSGTDDEDHASDNEVPGISFYRKLLFALASPPSTVATVLGTMYSTVYFLSVARISPAYAAGLIFGSRVLDGFTDPVMGYILDKFTTPWGRYRPWVLVSAPLFGATFFAFYSIPPIETEPARFAFILIFYLLMMIFKTTYHIPYTSMTVVISRRSSDRDQATTMRIMTDILALIGTALMFSLVTSSGQGHTGCKYENQTETVVLDNGTSVNETTQVPLRVGYKDFDDAVRKQYMLASGIIWIFIVCCGLIGFFGIRELLTAKPSDETESEAEKKVWYKELYRMLLICYHHKPYFIMCMGFVFFGMAVHSTSGILNLFIIQALKQSIQSGIYRFGLTIILVCSLFGCPLVFGLQLLVSKKVMAISGCLVWGCVLIIVSSLSSAVASGSVHIAGVFVLLVVAGFANSCYFVLPWLMITDTIDNYELNNDGRRDESVFYAFFSFIEKSAVGIALGFNQIALAIGKHNVYIGIECPQPRVVLSLKLSVGLINCIYALVAAIIFAFYPITKADRLAMDEALAQQSKMRKESNSNASRDTVSI